MQPHVSRPTSLTPLLALAAYTFYVQTLPVFTRPFVAREFGLDDSAMSLVEGLAAVGALGTFWLTRRADRSGRRGAILLTVLGTAAGGLLGATAPVVFFYVIAGTVLRAFVTALQMVVAVAVNEEAPDAMRARRQAYFGLVAGLGGAIPVIASGLIEDVPGGWRWLYAAAALPALGLVWIQRALPETDRFERARSRGVTETSRAWDLFQPRYRRRAVGLLAASTLRSAGLVAIATWAYYHAIENLGLSANQVTLIYLSAAIGMLGNPYGAWMANRLGRRPGLVINVLVTLGAGLGYYWVPGGMGPATFIPLAVAFNLFAFASNGFSVANRLLDSECFPTHLRATYTGANALCDAGGVVVSYLVLSALLLWLDDLSLAITILSGTTVLASVPIFLATAPETRGLTLEEASREDVA